MQEVQSSCAPSTQCSLMSPFYLAWYEAHNQEIHTGTAFLINLLTSFSSFSSFSMNVLFLVEDPIQEHSLPFVVTSPSRPPLWDGSSALPYLPWPGHSEGHRPGILWTAPKLGSVWRWLTIPPGLYGSAGSYRHPVGSASVRGIRRR